MLQCCLFITAVAQIVQTANESCVLLRTHLQDLACLAQWQQVSAIDRTVAFAKLNARLYDSEFPCSQVC